MVRCTEHGQVRVVVATGSLITGFCASCSGWLETIIDPDILQNQPVHSGDRFDREIEVDGVVRSMRDWARANGISANSIYKRLRRGWTARESVMSPPGTRLADASEPA